MVAIALRSMGERKLRSVLTAVAILLGVAMIAGTYVQTDRISAAFDGILQTANEGTDVVVTPETTFTSDFAPSENIQESVLEEVRAVPGVAQAEGVLFEGGNLVVNGEAVGSSMAPSMVISHVAQPFDPMKVVDGAMPRRSGEVAVDAQVAKNEGLDVGDRVELGTRSGVKPVTISGIAEYGEAQSIGGATMIIALLPDMQRWFGTPYEVSEIKIAAAEGTSPRELARRVRDALPPDLKVETGEQNAQANADEINDQIGSFLTPALLALSGAALLVGAFIIFNTFSITVAQRTREFGLLRAMGATRRQILGAVGVEALALGVGASILGIVAGLGVASLLGSLFNAVGWGIPAAGLELAPRTIVLALGVGIGVTLIAAVSPARRATRVPPIAALRDDAASAGPPRHRRLAKYAAAGVSVVGVLLLVQGLFGSGPAAGRLSALAGGAVMLFIGIALVARYVVRPLAGAIGWPLGRTFHEPGRLARENAMRNPARTATTSAALMVGLGLVVFVAVFAAGLKSSISGSIQDLVKADVIITGKSFQPLPSAAGQAIENVPGVRTKGPQYVDQIQVNGQKVDQLTDTVNGVDPLHMSQAYEFEWVGGGSERLVRKLGNGTALIEEQFAETHRIAVGERFRIETASGGKATLTAIGEYRDPQLLQGIMVDTATFHRVSSMRDPFSFFVAADPGVEASVLRDRIDAALERYPTAEVRTNADYRKLIEGEVDKLVYLLYALLAMSLIISLFGIANSLFLSIHERVREFGLLRAIGATQAQVRRVVRWESVITAVIGGVMGTFIGVVFAALATASLSDLGLTFTVPAGQLLAFLVLAVIVGVLGAVVPARRAAAVDVLDAMRHE